MSGKFILRENLGGVQSTSSVVSRDSFSPVISRTQIHTDSSLTSPIKDIRIKDDIDSSVTSTVSAIISAVLALVILLLFIFIVQALKRWRRERQGTRLNQPVVLAIAPPAFAPITAAYTSRANLSLRNVTWENVSNSSAPILLPIQQDDRSSHHQQTPVNDSIISSASSSNALSYPSSSCL